MPRKSIKKRPSRADVNDPSVWLHLENNTSKEAEYLRKRYDYHPIDLKEILPPLQRPKLVLRDDYLFMILLFPIFNRFDGTIRTSEVDFFISPNRLVTVNADKIPSINYLYRQFGQRSEGKVEIAGILHDLLSALLESVFPMLVHISQDIDDVEKHLFNGNQREVISELLRIKTNIVNTRKAMQGQQKVIHALMDEGAQMVRIYNMHEYYERLVEYTREIWDMLDVQRDTINALHEAHAAYLSNKTGEIMKLLTIFSVVIFPITFVATLFAMDVSGIPFHDDPFGFYKVLGLISIVILMMVLFFKKKKWF
ncbi:MAG: magnesium transporter CorA family protein [Patescibacteria group bacterium]|nr:magnesium transporter CorA family protein [Patescibacteria group bacterium]